jgi:uncharacterized membrane-anchored protein
MPRKHPHGPVPAWLARQVRGADEPAWLAAMDAQPKVDGQRMLDELEEAAARLDERRAARARRREAERWAGGVAWERAHQERDGRVPVAASLSWWGARPPVRIW